MKKLGSVFVFSAVATAISLSLASAAFAQTRTIKYGYPLPMVEYVPLYAAQQQGYLRDENLSVELYALNTGDKITLALASGSVDIASYTPDWFIRAMQKDAPIKIVAGLSNAPVYGLVTSPDVKTYADLKGKRLAVSSIKASDAYVMRNMLKANGLDNGDYDLVQAGSSTDRAAALKAGSVAAALLVPPYDSVVIGEGYKRLDLSTNTIRHYTWLAQAAPEGWARANKSTLIGFIKAWIKGTRFAYDAKNKPEVIRILMKELQLNEELATSAWQMYYGSSTEIVAKDGAIDLVGLQNLIDAVGSQGDLGSPPYPKAITSVDDSYLSEAKSALK
jgi:ABC-type nitrate/sulfonate/bicarbonate transport system substrate-binding protein